MVSRYVFLFCPTHQRQWMWCGTVGACQKVIIVRAFFSRAHLVLAGDLSIKRNPASSERDSTRAGEQTTGDNYIF